MIQYIERNGIIFQVDPEHPFRRFGPLAIAVGAAVSAYGQYQAGKAAEEQGKAEQAIAEHNAKIKEREAAAELERARAQAEKFRLEGEGLQGQQKVAFAKGGVLSTVGTPALLLEETAMNLEADRMEILKQGFLGRSFRLSEAEGQRAVGSAARARGKNIRTASRYQSGGSLLTGIGNAAYMNSMDGTSKDMALAKKHGIR